jgi:hypothetical protein
MVGSAVIFLDTINFGQQLMFFIFAGIIPGTNIVIAPIDVMAATATAITVIILRITVWPIVSTIITSDSRVKHKAV